MEYEKAGVYYLRCLIGVGVLIGGAGMAVLIGVWRVIRRWLG